MNEAQRSEESGLTLLLYGGNALVPLSVAKCPECGAQLHAESTVWGAERGEPNTGDVMVDCTADPECEHRHWQCDWQPVVDAVERWCGATDV
ncbi:MAG: hypothetical protein CME61_08715 [Halobacteriovoraceae bacterium]|nr:hypothetical protein [Halobacteriovoraceae bacterium]OUX68075.1 MAG: hypothetical protein CBD38_00465 [bacterium TMED178]